MITEPEKQSKRDPCKTFKSLFTKLPLFTLLLSFSIAGTQNARLPSSPLLINVAIPGRCGVVMYLKSQLRIYFGTIFLRTCHLSLKRCRNSVCFGCNFSNNMLFSCKHPLYPEKGRKKPKTFKVFKEEAMCLTTESCLENCKVLAISHTEPVMILY